jgi:hypothetical protein
MQATLPSCLNIASYHEDALRSAMGSKVEAMSVDLKIIRLICALTDGDYADAHATLDLLSGQDVLGYAAFQASTARLTLAALEQDRVAFDTTMIQWNQERSVWPENWDDAVLDTPLIKPWVNIKIKPKPESIRPRIDAKDVLYVKDLSQSVTRAVQDNVEWLRQLGHVGPIADLADAYHLASVDRALNEATLKGRNDMPDLVVALDETGGYLGSFLAH